MEPTGSTETPSTAGPSQETAAPGAVGISKNAIDDEHWWHSEGSATDDDDIPAANQEEDPYYDPELDDKDAAWLDKLRKGRVSDAMLSCPGCFTTLCVDCQRHALYPTQYRAMFVLNCEVDRSQLLSTPAGPQGGTAAGGKKGKAKGQRQQQQQQAPQGEAEVFHPVLCAACSTQVGVQDADGMYHFFHVFPSNA